MLLRRWLSISSWSGKASGLLVATQSQELLSKGGLGPGGHSAGRPFSAGFSLKCGFRERLLFRNGRQAALLSSWGPSRPPPALPRQVSPSSGTTAGCEGGRDMQPAQGGSCGIGSHHRGRESKGRSRPRQIRLCPQSLGRGPRSSECGESLKWGWAAAWAWVRLGQETSESSRPAPALQLRLSVGQSLRGRARARTAREKRGSQNTGRFSKPGHCPTRHPAPSSYMRTWEHNAGNFMPSPSRTEASLSQTRTLRPRRERYKDIKSLEYFQRWVTAVFPNCGLLLGFHPSPA